LIEAFKRQNSLNFPAHSCINHPAPKCIYTYTYISTYIDATSQCKKNCSSLAPAALENAAVD